MYYVHTWTTSAAVGVSSGLATSITLTSVSQGELGCVLQGGGELASRFIFMPYFVFAAGLSFKWYVLARM
jgi:hypothetical protein